MPLPPDAELPPIYPMDIPGDDYATMIGRWECRKKGIGPDVSALLIRSLIEYARKRGRTALDQITDGFIAEWSAVALFGRFSAPSAETMVSHAHS